MADLFIRFQRLVDRLIDGESATAPELASVAPLFLDRPGRDPAVLAAQLARQAWPEQRIPAGPLVAGRATEAEVNWTCEPSALPALAARCAATMALLGQALDLPELEAQQFAARIGLDLSSCRTLLENSSLRWLDPGPAALPALTAPWRLVVSHGVPLVDLVAPYVRDVAGSIDAFAASIGERIRDDDDRYAVLPALLAQDPRLAAERAEQEAGLGIQRDPSGLVQIEPARLDDRAVDLRVRNAVTALRRQTGSVVIAPCQRALLEALLAAAPEPPRCQLIVSAAPGLGEQVLLPEWLTHLEGHLLPADAEEAEAVAGQLPRELAWSECSQLVSVPGCAQLRDEVRRALLGQVDAVDGAAYGAALALVRGGEEGLDGAVDGVACLVADRGLAVELGLAVWRWLARSSRRPARSR